LKSIAEELYKYASNGRGEILALLYIPEISRIPVDLNGLLRHSNSLIMVK
jgi:hypothetical protein